MSSSPLPINDTMNIQKEEEDDLKTRRLKVIEGINILLSLVSERRSWSDTISKENNDLQYQTVRLQ